MTTLERIGNAPDQEYLKQPGRPWDGSGAIEEEEEEAEEAFFDDLLVPYEDPWEEDGSNEFEDKDEGNVDLS